MSTGERGLTDLWREIDGLLTQARVSHSLHQSETLLDLDPSTGCAETPLHARLAQAMDGWDGRLLLTATGDDLAPDIQIGDRLVIDPGREARDGDLVVVFTGGTLLVRRLQVRDGQHWLAAGGSAPLPLGPLVALVGVVSELRRVLRQ